MKNFIISLFTILLIISCKNEPQQLIKIEGKLLPINQEIESVKEINDFIQTPEWTFSVGELKRFKE